MEIIKDIAAVVGCILSIISLIAIFTKGGRSFIKSLFQKNTQDLKDENQRQTSDIKEIKNTLDQILQKMEIHEQLSKQQCRNTIKDIYYKYHKDKKIPLYERKTADNTHKLYCRMPNANSYETLLYKEICKWEIDTIAYQDLVDES